MDPPGRRQSSTSSTRSLLESHSGGEDNNEHASLQDANIHPPHNTGTDPETNDPHTQIPATRLRGGFWSRFLGLFKRSTPSSSATVEPFPRHLDPEDPLLKHIEVPESETELHSIDMSFNFINDLLKELSKRDLDLEALNLDFLNQQRERLVKDIAVATQAVNFYFAQYKKISLKHRKAWFKGRYNNQVSQAKLQFTSARGYVALAYQCLEKIIQVKNTHFSESNDENEMPDDFSDWQRQPPQGSSQSPPTSITHEALIHPPPAEYDDDEEEFSLAYENLEQEPLTQAADVVEPEVEAPLENDDLDLDDPASYTTPVGSPQPPSFLMAQDPAANLPSPDDQPGSLSAQAFEGASAASGPSSLIGSRRFFGNDNRDGWAFDLTDPMFSYSYDPFDFYNEQDFDQAQGQDDGSGDTASLQSLHGLATSSTSISPPDMDQPSGLIFQPDLNASPPSSTPPSAAAPMSAQNEDPAEASLPSASQASPQPARLLVPTTPSAPSRPAPVTGAIDPNEPFADVLLALFPDGILDPYIGMSEANLRRIELPVDLLTKIFRLTQENISGSYEEFVKALGVSYKKIALKIHPDKHPGISPEYFKLIVNLKEAFLNQLTPENYDRFDLVGAEFEQSGYDISTIPLSERDRQRVARPDQLDDIRPDHYQGYDFLCRLFMNAKIQTWSKDFPRWFFAEKYMTVLAKTLDLGGGRSMTYQDYRLTFSKYYIYFENERRTRLQKHGGETILHCAYNAYCAEHGKTALDFKLPVSNASLNLIYLVPLLGSQTHIGLEKDLERLLKIFGITDNKAIFGTNAGNLNRALQKTYLDNALKQCEGCPSVFANTLKMVMQQITNCIINN